MILEDLNTITLEKAQGAVKALLLANPEGVNPTEYAEGGSCLYSRTRSAEAQGDNAQPNCIAGGAFVFLGADPVEVDCLANGPATSAARELSNLVFTTEAAEWLRRVQRVADGVGGWLSLPLTQVDAHDEENSDTGTSDGKPRQWGVVFAILVAGGAFNAINNTF